MTIESTLENIGLTKNEIKIYLALLELGQTTSGAIIKKTGIHTSKVYDGLERLLEKGLVTYVIISNTKNFKAVDPDRLMDFLEEKKRKISEEEQQIREVLPRLKLMQGLVKDETQAEIFQGWKGLETVYSLLRKTVKKGDTNYVLGASKGEDEETVKKFFNKHLSLLALKKIKQKIIYNEEARENIHEQHKHPELFEVKYMQNTTPAEINIWADKVMIVILTKKPTAILISNPKVAESYKTFFNLLWEAAK